MTATSVGEIYFLLGSFFNYVDVVGCEMVLEMSMVCRFALITSKVIPSSTKGRYKMVKNGQNLVHIVKERSLV